MWKSLVVGAVCAVVAASLTSWAGSIQYMNPGNLAIPSTVGDFNKLIALINLNAILSGPNGLNTGAAYQQSGSFSVSPIDQYNGTNPYVNGIRVAGEVSGVGPVIAAIGSDTNVDLRLYAQGSGLVRFFNPTMWQSSPTVTPCPIGRGSSGAGGNQQALAFGATYNKALLIKDELGNIVAIPGCIVGNAASGL